MERKYPNLCSPIQIGNVMFRNRMFSAPMGGTDITADCCIGRGSTAFYELRAKGGAGAVTVSECMVHPERRMWWRWRERCWRTRICRERCARIRMRTL